MISRKGCAGLRRKVFRYIICSCLPTRKIGTHCVDVGSALKNDVVQAGLVFDVVLYLASISRSRCLITLCFFYKNLIYKNVEAEIDPNFKNVLRTFLRLRVD